MWSNRPRRGEGMNSAALSTQEGYRRRIVGFAQDQPAAVDAALQGVIDHTIELGPAALGDVAPTGCLLRSRVGLAALASEGDCSGILSAHFRRRFVGFGGVRITSTFQYLKPSTGRSISQPPGTLAPIGRSSLRLQRPIITTCPTRPFRNRATIVSPVLVYAQGSCTCPSSSRRSTCAQLCISQRRGRVDAVAIRRGWTSLQRGVVGRSRSSCP